MSFTDDKMQSLIYGIRNLNNNMGNIKELMTAIEISNKLKYLEMLYSQHLIDKDSYCSYLKEIESSILGNNIKRRGK